MHGYEVLQWTTAAISCIVYNKGGRGCFFALWVVKQLLYPPSNVVWDCTEITLSEWHLSVCETVKK